MGWQHPCGNRQAQCRARLQHFLKVSWISVIIHRPDFWKFIGYRPAAFLPDAGYPLLWIRFHYQYCAGTTGRITGGHFICRGQKRWCRWWKRNSWYPRNPAHTDTPRQLEITQFSRSPVYSRWCQRRGCILRCCSGPTPGMRAADRISWW